MSHLQAQQNQQQKGIFEPGINTQKMEETSVISDRQLQQAGYEEALLQQSSHQSSRFVLNNKTKEDTIYMTNVKNAEKAIIDFFSAQALGRDQGEFEAKLRTAETLYQNLIHHCDIYENTHKYPLSTSGKERKRMVKHIRKTAVSESGKLVNTATILFRRNKEETTWSDILGSMRVSYIDLSFHNIETTGGASSDVTVIDYKNTSLYYKKEEPLLPLQEEIRELYLKKPEWKQYQNLLGKLASLIDKADISTLILLQQWYDDISPYTDLAEQNGISFSSSEKRQLQELLPQFCPVLNKLVTRRDLAQDAGIEQGEDLVKRNVATSRLASLLGIQKLVTDSAMVSLTNKQDDKTVSELGIVTVKASGATLSGILKQGLPVLLTESVLKDLINLQIFDTICGQIDRNPSNLFFTYEERDGKRFLTHVTGIDSDMAFGVKKYDDFEKFKDGIMKLKPIEPLGQCNLPYMDSKLCASITTLDQETVELALKDLLSPKELEALWDRIQGVRNFIQKYPNIVADGTGSLTSYLDTAKLSADYRDTYAGAVGMTLMR